MMIKRSIKTYSRCVILRNEAAETQEIRPPEADVDLIIIKELVGLAIDFNHFGLQFWNLIL